MDYTLDEHFRPQERLKTREEFLRTQRRGRRRESAHLIVYAHPNQLDWSRLGLTVSKKVGNAVVRNRWKRRLREAFRRNKSLIPVGYDFVVVAKRGVDLPSSSVLTADLLGVSQRAAKVSPRAS